MRNASVNVELKFQKLGIQRRVRGKNFLLLRRAESEELKLLCQSLSLVRLFVLPWTVALQAPLSMELSRQGYWIGLPFSFPGELPDSGIKSRSPALQADSFPFERLGKRVIYHLVGITAAAKSLQSCPTLCEPIDGSPPSSPVPGILQAKTLEWAAISFSKGITRYV